MALNVSGQDLYREIKFIVDAYYENDKIGVIRKDKPFIFSMQKKSLIKKIHFILMDGVDALGDNDIFELKLIDQDGFEVYGQMKYGYTSIYALATETLAEFYNLRDIEF